MLEGQVIFASALVSVVLVRFGCLGWLVGCGCVCVCFKVKNDVYERVKVCLVTLCLGWLVGCVWLCLVVRGVCVC